MQSDAAAALEWKGLQRRARMRIGSKAPDGLAVQWNGPQSSGLAALDWLAGRGKGQRWQQRVVADRRARARVALAAEHGQGSPRRA